MIPIVAIWEIPRHDHIQLSMTKATIDSKLLLSPSLLPPSLPLVLEALIAKCPPDRQICLFSATFPVTVKGFKQKFLPNAYIINLMDELTLRGISQFYAFVEERQKVTFPSLNILPARLIYFCSSRSYSICYLAQS
jgi:hypothetical protein